MRRKLAYFLLTGALIVGVGATIGPSIMNMDTDITYGEGRDIVFRILDHDDNRNGLINGIDDDDYVSDDNYRAVDLVAEEFEDRLEHWGANAYVRKEGYDTIVVSLRTQDDDETEYTYIRNYLAYSGGNLTVAAGCTDETVQSEAPQSDAYINNNMFVGQTATIEYVNNIPVVAIEVNYPGEDGELATLIDYCTEHTVAADEETQQAEVNCYLVLWNGFREGDSFAKAYDTSSEDHDPNMAGRLVFGENAASAWYDEDNDDDDYTRLQLVPNSEAIQDGIYDESKAGAAYKAALYYSSLLNASSYIDMGASYDVMYAYTTDIDPTVEALLAATDWHWTVSMNSTMIACLSALAIAIIVLAIFYRLGSLAILSSALFSIEGAILLLGYFGSQFNIGILVGLVLGALVAIFGGVYYFAKMREQLYLGRSPKKAHTEAAKKSVWPTLDVGIIAIILGLCVYYLIPSSSVGAIGISLVWAAAFATLFNLVVLRLEGWLLANSKSTVTKYSSYYLVDPEKVSEPGNDKPVYEGPYAKHDFQKRKKVWGIVLSVLAVASIAGLSVFSIKDGVSFNYSGAYEDTTSINMEYRVNSGTSATLLFKDSSDVQEDYLPNITYYASNGAEGQTLLQLANVSSIVSEERTISVSGGVTIVQYDIYYFSIPLNTVLPLTEGGEDSYHFVVQTSASSTETVYSLSAALETLNTRYTGVTSEAARVTVQPGVPTLAQLYLGLGVGLASIIVYLLLRFRSRGFAAGLLAFAATLPAVGFFALTRIPVGPTVMMGAVITAFVALILPLFILNKEIEINHDSREKNKRAIAYRNDCLKEANGAAAGEVLVYAILSMAIVLVYFGLSPSSSSLAFLGAFIAILLSLVAVLVLLEPLSLLFSKWSRSIYESIRRSNSRGKNEGPRGQIGKKQGAEQEETIFIGIND